MITIAVLYTIGSIKQSLDHAPLSYEEQDQQEEGKQWDDVDASACSSTFEHLEGAFSAAASSKAMKTRPTALPVATVAKRSSKSAITTARYRAWLESHGVLQMHDKNTIEIDHIIPRKIGGADHPFNYAPVVRSINNLKRSEAPSFAYCLVVVGLYRCGRAVATSGVFGSISEENRQLQENAILREIDNRIMNKTSAARYIREFRHGLRAPTVHADAYFSLNDGTENTGTDTFNALDDLQELKMMLSPQHPQRMLGMEQRRIYLHSTAGRIDFRPWCGEHKRGTRCKIGSMESLRVALDSVARHILSVTQSSEEATHLRQMVRTNS